jgi:chromosomal replication initiator protein
MYLSRLMTNRSLSDIGGVFGKRDHGTVIHACKTVENAMEQDISIRRTVENLQRTVQCGF